MSDTPRTKEDDKQLDVVDDDIRTEISELRKDKERLDWLLKKVLSGGSDLKQKQPAIRRKRHTNIAEVGLEWLL